MNQLPATCREMVPLLSCGHHKSILIPEPKFSLQLTTNLPRFPADECEKISRTMHDSKNDSLVVLQEIDDTVTSEDQFSKVRAIELWNHSPNLGRFEQGLGRFNDAINNVIAWRTESRAIKSSIS
jgi:hypothetical protein